jgi:hypothetical protein
MDMAALLGLLDRSLHAPIKASKATCEATGGSGDVAEHSRIVSHALT